MSVAILMILLVSAAVGAHRPLFVLMMILSVSATVLTVARLLPHAATVSATLATCIAIYTAAFTCASIGVFRGASWAAEAVGFVLPLLGLVAGVAWKRQVIRARLLRRQRRLRQRILLRGIGWLAACFSIGAVAAATGPVEEDASSATVSLLWAMAAIAATTVWFAPDIACLLDETGRLFRLFLVRMRTRIVPIFSFLIVFLMIGAVFATLYALVDHHAARPAFSVAGAETRLTLPDAVYFSFVTLSTIGYGDITPVNALARFLVLAEIVFGVVLLLFAFSEIASYDPEAEPEDDAPLEGQHARAGEELERQRQG